MNVSFHLFQIQKIDTQIDRINSRKLELEKMTNENSIIISDKKALNTAESDLTAINSQIGEIETEINQKKIKIQQSESSLYGGSVKNPKELQSLQTEITSIKSRIKELEDSQIDLFLKVENQEKIIGERKDILTNHIGKKNIELNAAELELQEMSKSMEKLLSERNFLTSQINIPDLKLYQDLREKKRNLAVSSLNDDACSACGTQLTPGDIQAAKSPTRIFFCPSCGRIIYAG